MKTKQISFRAPSEFFERMDRLSEHLAQPGLTLTTVDVLRMIAFRGLETLEAEKLPKKKGKKS